MDSSAHESRGRPPIDPPAGTPVPTELASMGDLDANECWHLVSSEPLGRVAFVAAGRPVVLPVNHTVDERSIVFRTDPDSLLGHLVADEPVAFEADGYDTVQETGWSVLVAGEIERVDRHARARLSGREPKPWAPGDHDDWIRIVPHVVTGRRLVRRRHGGMYGRYLPYMPPD